jgi:hypothetical protein
MLILFDHGTPAPLRSYLEDHILKKTKDLGWDTLVVLGNSRWPVVQLYVDRIVAAGTYTEVEVPDR